MIAAAAARRRRCRSRQRPSWLAAIPAPAIEGSVPSPNAAMAAAPETGSACAAVHASVA